MKLPPLRSAVFPASGPRWDIVVASVFLVATAASLVSAKTLAFTAAVFIAVLAATQAWRGQLSFKLLSPSRNTLPILALIAYAAVTLLWTQVPFTAFGKLATIAAIGLAALFAVRTIAAEVPPNIARLGESLWIGLIVGLLYLIVRNLTGGAADGAVLPPMAHKFVTLDLAEMTRSIAPATLLIGPALLAITAGFLKPWRAIFSAILVCVAILAIATSQHETSKLALVAWVIVFVLAYLSDRLSYRIIQAGWLAACLLVVPVSIMAKAYDLQNASWLQLTAQQRILIWNEFAELTLQRPVFGHGFEMSATSKPEIPGLAELSYANKGKTIPANLTPFRALHPHNAYLQVWYELGAVGVGLFVAAGLSLLNGLSKLQPYQRPYMYATAAATSVLLFSSYGLWQLWLIGLLSFAAIACTIAIRLSTEPETSEADAS